MQFLFFGAGRFRSVGREHDVFVVVRKGGAISQIRRSTKRSSTRILGAFGLVLLV
jgi:hypothetical protein